MVVKHLQQLSPHKPGTCTEPVLAVQKTITSDFWVLAGWMLAQTHLIKGPYRVYFGLDFALTVEVNQLGYYTSNKLKFFIHISEVVATHGLVLVEELQGIDAELVPPGFSHSHEVLLLPSEQVCHP